MVGAAHPPSALLAVSSTELTIRMVVGLVLVVVLLLALNRVTRRFLAGRPGRGPAIAVRHQQRLDRHTSVTLLTAGERHLLIGTSGQSIVLLAEGDDLAADEAPVTAEAGAAGGSPRSVTVDLRPTRWTSPIRALQNLTVRRH